MDPFSTSTRSIIVLSLLLIVLFVDQSHSATARFNTSNPSAIESFALDKRGEGTRWAVLVAGSKGYMNYRHQADICHAYQILKKGGLKDENIVVFMYDDIAYHEKNPKKGVIINHPRGQSVYKGVPKDYTGKAVTVNNLLAAILGDKSSIEEGSGKVVDSGPNDRIFIYYSDHGAPGLLAMPVGPYLYAPDFIDALKTKHASKSYKSMVIYMEACEAGSMFDGLLPEDLNIYVTTASNAFENSYATYCPGDPNVPLEYKTCLGDLYSISWMEDSEKQDSETKSLQEQYQVVKERTSEGSHVMQYGNVALSYNQKVSEYMGASKTKATYEVNQLTPRAPLNRSLVDQRGADLIYLMEQAHRTTEGLKENHEAVETLEKELSHRLKIDRSIKFIGQTLFGSTHDKVLKTVRPAGQPLVDDWDCLKTMIDTYETHCGPLSTYGLKYTRAFANICNAGVDGARFPRVLKVACI